MLVIAVFVNGNGRAAVLLGEVSGFGGEKLSSEVALGLVICVAALAGLSEFELRVGGLQALVVRWAAEGFFATSLEEILLGCGLGGFILVGRLTGSKVGLCAVVMAATLKGSRLCDVVEDWILKLSLVCSDDLVVLANQCLCLAYVST